MGRTLFTISKAWKYRSSLRQLARRVKVKDLSELDFNRLKAHGTKVIVFDFDGVLATQGEEAPNELGKKRLARAFEIFGAGRVFFLSNKPLPNRIAYLAKHYPDIPFIVAKKKPYPDGLQSIIKTTGVLSREVMLIDDRLLTGGLACALANARFCYITKACSDFKKHPWDECFYGFLRWLEKWLF